MNRRRLAPTLLSVLACMTVAQAQTSQTAGALRGTVRSKGGGALKGAVVNTRNLETGFQRTAVSGDQGEFSIPLLPIGRYEMTVSAAGMKTIKDSSIIVSLGAATTVNPTLDRAEASAVVEVTAASSAIDATQTGTVAYVDQKLVEEVPLVTRNFTDMARLAPGVVAGQGSGNNPRLIVEGGRQIFNAIQIDGASNNSAFFGEQRGGVYTPFIFGADTIKELQIITNGFDVQYGQAGATVNAITKNGANETFGSALYEMRRTSWSAKPKPIPYDPNGTFNTPTNLQRFNDSYNVNFNLGGAIVRDKVWYFFGVERFHRSITANPVPTSVSSAPGLTQADFDAFTASRLGQVVTNRSGLTLAQELGNPGKGIPAHPYSMENTNTVYFGRLDFAATAKHRFVLRCNYQTMDDTLQNTSANPNNAESNNIPTKVTSISWVGEANSIWTSELFTESRLQFAREGRPMRNNAAPGVPAIRIPSAGTFMDFGTKTSTPRESNELTTQFFSATTWNHGDWQVKGGVDYMKVDEDNQFFQNNAGSFQFATYAIATAWSNGTLGASTPGMTTSAGINYAGAVSPYFGRIPMWTKMMSFFGQAQYNGLMEKRLTLALGLRTFNQSFSNNPHPNPNFQGLDQGFGGSGVDPRLSFSLDLDGKGKTVIRGGVGVFTSPTPLLLHSNTMTGNGQIITNYALNLRSNSATNIFDAYNTGLLSAGQLISGSSMTKVSDANLPNLTSAASTTSLWDPDNKLSQSKKATLGVEHEYANNLVLGASLTFVRYENLQRFENINLGQVGGSAYNDGYAPGGNWLWNGTRPNTATIRGRRVDFNKGSVTPFNPPGGFSDVYLVKSDGWGHYRGISFSARKSWNEKTGFFANVTYARAQDTGSFERGTYTSASSDFTSELGASLTPDPQSPASNYGYGDSDRRIVANLVAYFPVAWGVNASVRGLFQTGLPYSVYDAADVNKDGMANHFWAGHNRNDQRQPSYTQIDLRFSRAFKVHKKVQVEGILDIYNLFNKADFTIPSANFKYTTSSGALNAAFGQLASVNKDRTREVQVGLRVKF
ncbi:MAG: carboxypeptidase regulatory-like domain-containing protein [Acidobacteria bacterium]|nr:carboxypeptidase regulatory-like domain-containing protein [Acidobacteriota bacterium]